MHTPIFYRIYGLPLFVQRFLVMIDTAIKACMQGSIIVLITIKMSSGILYNRIILAEVYLCKYGFQITDRIKYKLRDKTY